MSQTPNPKLVKHISNYLMKPSKVEAKPSAPRLVERIALACRQNRDKATSGRATATTPGILWPLNPTPSQPPKWTKDEAARFLQMVARTDDLTGNCC